MYAGWKDDRLSQWLGWLFCNASFRANGWADGTWAEDPVYYMFGGWAYRLGCWFYDHEGW